MPTLKERFEDKYILNKETNCWDWTGGKSHNGYGQIQGKVNSKWTPLRAHRVAYTLFIGDIPEGMLVCHKCDNPSCVNPEHLFVGSHADNSRDMAKKGRSSRQVVVSKIDKKTAEKIRKLYKTNNYYQRELGKLFGLTQTGISKIILNKVWA